MINVFLVQNADNMKILLLQLEKIQYLRDLQNAARDRDENANETEFSKLFDIIDKITDMKKSSVINFNELSQADILYCLNRYEEMLKANANDVLNINIDHKLGNTCVAKIQLAYASDAKYCIVTYHHKIFMTGKLIGNDYDVAQNIHTIDFEAKHNIKHDQVIEQLKEEIYGKNFIKDLKKLKLSNIIIDRCSDNISLLHRSNRELKIIDNFFPYTMRVSQTHLSADSITCRLHAYWNYYTLHEQTITKKIYQIALDKRSIERILPQNGSKYGKYIIKNTDIKYIKSKAYDEDYECDIEVKLFIESMNTIRVDEVCNATIKIPVARNVAKTELEVVDIYCDVSDDMYGNYDESESIYEWETDKEYSIDDRVIYNKQIFICTQNNKDDAFDEYKWRIIDVSEITEKNTVVDDKMRVLRILPKILVILEQFAEYYMYAFRVSVIIPITDENMKIKIGDCIDMSRFDLKNIGNIGYVECMNVVINNKEAYIHVDISTQAAKDITMEIDAEMTEQMGLLRYNKLDASQMHNDISKKLDKITFSIPNADIEEKECVLIEREIPIEYQTYLYVHYDA